MEVAGVNSNLTEPPRESTKSGVVIGVVRGNSSEADPRVGWKNEVSSPIYTIEGAVNFSQTKSSGMDLVDSRFFDKFVPGHPRHAVLRVDAR